MKEIKGKYMKHYGAKINVLTYWLFYLSYRLNKYSLQNLHVITSQNTYKLNITGTFGRI